MFELSEEICRDLSEATRREWLETNGLGGYASSTVAGVNTRRYHGLLVAATRPPVGRTVLLSKLEETLVVGGTRIELSANQYPGAAHPQGHRLMNRFRLDPFPIFTYRVAGLELEKSVLMLHGENTVCIRYVLRDGAGDSRQSDVRLEIRPLIAFRDYHGTTHENGALDPSVHSEEGRLTVTPYEGLPALHFAHEGGEADVVGCWYRNFVYAEERARGFDAVEDLFSPFALKFDLSRRNEVSIIASTERRDASRAGALVRAEFERREEVLRASPSDDEAVRALVAAADQYVVARDAQKTVIAGYHWFGDWGRDTMIALPGLALVMGRFEVAKSILAEFARHVSRGMLPNRFTEAGEEPEYNTVDATLWYFEAVRALCAYTNSAGFVRANLYGVLKEIVEWHERGTRHGIRVGMDGLLTAGEEGTQLTWMDAKVGDRVITPRRGKPVEIQALWYNALRVMEELAREFGMMEDEFRYGAMASYARRSFNEQFWNEEADCLCDVVDGAERDASLRPNQIFAVSLRHSMLSAERARRVVEAVGRELLTPYGLRSLAPSDPRYSGRYRGGPAERDAVYHQGSVWAWLIGPYVTAYLRVNGRTPETVARARSLLAPLVGHLREACLGHVSEIFDGDAPHAPRGCAAQAWSAAELLRALIEDVQGVRPDHLTRPPDAEEVYPCSPAGTRAGVTLRQDEKISCKDSRARATNGCNEPYAAARASNHLPLLRARLL
jgi:predicted glycogen debranching enzyme